MGPTVGGAAADEAKLFGLGIKLPDRNQRFLVEPSLIYSTFA